MKTIVLLALLLGTVRCGDYSEMSRCTADPTNIQFTLKSCRNQTGYWEAEVQLDHTDVGQDVAAWNVVIDQTLEPKCDGPGEVSVVATFTVPPQGNAVSKQQLQKHTLEGNAVVKTQPKKRIPEGYRKFSEGHYFKTHTQTVIWIEARHICDEEGAHLAIVNSEAEARFMAAMWPSNSNLAFIGFNDLYEEGHYVTVNNKTLRDTGYVKWSGGEPNGGITENCGAMAKDMLLWTHWCTVLLPFLCELEY